MYDILFLSRVIPAHLDKEVRGKMSNTMDDAAIAWQHHIIEGIEKNINLPVTLLNYLPIKSFPHNYTDPFIKRSEFAHSPGAKDINLPFCNMKYVKRLVQGASLYREVKKWARQDRGHDKVIIAYTLYPEYLKAVEIAKKMSPNIISMAIVLDLPEYSILTNQISLYSRAYLNWSKSSAYKRLKYVDRFVLLTEAMAEELKLYQPYCIIEGIYSQELPKYIAKNSSTKQIFYAGTLHERFGVLHLLEAFQKIEDTNYRLIICGYGDSEEIIRKAAEMDKRIAFCGQLHRDAVLKLMMEATVIVNPRMGNEIFTKYSFPSKNLEALSSGIPFIGYKLEGIPDEYDEFINYPEALSADSLAKQIKLICEDKTGKYGRKAARAQEWVAGSKNAEKQAEKLLKLI